MLAIIFPHQLFRDHPALNGRPDRVLLIEDSLFFGDSKYPARFHKQKLWLHRASMRRFERDLKQRGFQTTYVEYDGTSAEGSLAARLNHHIDRRRKASQKLVVADPVDFVLEKRLKSACRELGLDLEFLSTPGFLNKPQENSEYRAGKKRWFMADFYQWQRRRFDILMDGDEPRGGKWSFDQENRKKVPKQLLKSLPQISRPQHDQLDLDAQESIEKQFATHPGELEQLIYPTSHSAAEDWLKDFLDHRFQHFGDYEDALVEGQSWLWHSVLTPMLNIGLLTPQQVIDETLAYADRHEVPLNSLEGFLRQIIGWREFMRATYQDLGSRMRTSNHWKHHRKMPDCFYTASTGLPPLDDTLRRILTTGYCHHIERLMVLGGFMFLCEIEPDDVYRWFMEMFVDSYDWVMVPNVYAMSQNADGGLITTKPYFSGSSYVRKMSHYRSGEWCDVWDGLYWRWIWKHRSKLGKNPRWAMMCSMAEKMDEGKRKRHLQNAQDFLDAL
ncbi:MAG: cryptochrome/photolyase family protein [bacterium]|nr:cryptochrome/photolyase family protein [bacterium]